MKRVYPQAQVLRPEATTQALRDRAEGRARNGSVNLFDFDTGVITSMGATLDEASEKYYVTIPRMQGPPGSPKDPIHGNLKIPIVFAIPEDVFTNFEIPIIVVRREKFSPNLKRWFPGQLQYRMPTYGSQTVVVNKGRSTEKRGPDAVEQRQQAVPYDIDYTISLIAKYRGGGKNQKDLIMSQPDQAMTMLNYMLPLFQPSTYIKLIDSIGDERTYDAEVFAISNLDSIPEVSERVAGFSFAMTVMGELDLAPVEVYRTATDIKIQENLIT